MGLSLTDSNQSGSGHLYLPSSPHCIFQKKVRSDYSAAHGKICNNVCICISGAENMNLIRPRNGYIDTGA